jgi:hypothetical protein
MVVRLVARQANVFYCRGPASSLRIPGSVCEIGDRVVYGLDSLRDLSFEEGILKVGVSPFNGCPTCRKQLSQYRSSPLRQMLFIIALACAISLSMWSRNCSKSAVKHFQIAI